MTGEPIPLKRYSPSAFACQPERADEAVRVSGEHHLAAVGRSEQAACPVEHGAKVVAAPRLDLARVDCHPHAQRAGLAPVDLRELDLHRLGGRDGGAGVGEGDVDAVAHPLDDLPAGCLHGTQHDPVVLGHRRPHRLRVQLPEHGRVLDVRQQERPRLDLRLRVGQERAVLVQDEALKLLELRRRLEAELVGQVRARLLVGAQRLGLPAGAVEREHVLRAEPLAHRVLLAQHLELARELRVTPERELRVDPRLDRFEPELFQPPRLHIERRRADNVGVRMAAPERERLPQRLRRLRLVRLRELAGIRDGVLEDERVDLVRFDLEAVAAAVADDDVADPAAQVRDIGVERGARRSGRLVAPDAVDQVVGRDHLAGGCGEQRQRRPFLAAAERERDAFRKRLNRPEHAQLQTTLAEVGAVCSSRQALLDVGRRHAVTLRGRSPGILQPRREPRVPSSTVRCFRRNNADLHAASRYDLSAPAPRGRRATSAGTWSRPDWRRGRLKYETGLAPGHVTCDYVSVRCLHRRQFVASPGPHEDGIWRSSTA